eukprot:SAG22_NODE_260_length_13403_cov_57.915589_12_plen_430_part_00
MTFVDRWWLAPRIASHRIASHRIASHRIASHRIASHRIASHRIACCRACQELFETIDADSDGQLTVREIKQGLAAIQAAASASATATDGDGDGDGGQPASTTKKKKQKKKKGIEGLSQDGQKVFQNAKKLFKAADADKSAAIDAHEFYEFMRAALAEATEDTANRPPPAAIAEEMFGTDPRGIVLEIAQRAATAAADGFLDDGVEHDVEAGGGGGDGDGKAGAAAGFVARGGPGEMLSTYMYWMAGGGGGDQGKDGGGGGGGITKVEATRHLFSDKTIALGTLRTADAHAAGAAAAAAAAASAAASAPPAAMAGEEAVASVPSPPPSPPDDGTTAVEAKAAEAAAEAAGGAAAGMNAATAGTFYYRFDYGSAAVPETALPYARHGSDVGFWLGTADRFPEAVGLADHAPHAEQVGAPGAAEGARRWPPT